MQLPQLNFTSVAGLTAIGAIIATTWRQIANIGQYVIGLVIGTAYLKDEAGNAAMAFMLAKSKKSPLGMRVFGGYDSYVHPKRWNEVVAYEGLGSDPVLIRYRKSFAMMSLGAFSSGETRNIGSYEKSANLVTLRYFRWFFNIEQFTIDAIDYYNNQKRQTNKEYYKQVKRISNRFKIYRMGAKPALEGGDRSAPSPAGKQGGGYPGGDSAFLEYYIMNGVFRLLKWNREDLQQQPEEGHSPFTGYPFPKEIELAIKELDQWLTHEKWFRSKSIPWRRGWSLYGPPGTGKSTLVRALGMSFDLPIYIFDLSGMTNEMLVRSWDDMMTNTPCIALFEDMDTIFEGRKFIATNGTLNHVTFDCLLNCISGVKQADGVLLIITTNHIDKLDPALGVPDKNTGRSTRPGRIDRAFCLGLMGEEQRLDLAKHILSDCPDLIDETVKAGEGETPAQFQARCAQLALSKFWAEERKAPEPDPQYTPAVAFSKPVDPVNYDLGSQSTDELYNKWSTVMSSKAKKVKL